ncbi:MAG: hypothetical protein IPL65_17025 [Lewinellaceae bacterium]|nr:hypothetical protein [Lewinellaceae bacterium]
MDNSSNAWSAQLWGNQPQSIQDRINYGCLFLCSSVHFEYGKVGEEGFRNREASEISETTTLYDWRNRFDVFWVKPDRAGSLVEGKRN